MENNQSLEKGMQMDKLSQIKDDYQNEWWKAKEIDEFNLKMKLLRVGCRPLKRKYL